MHEIIHMATVVVLLLYVNVINILLHSLVISLLDFYRLPPVLDV